MKETSDGVQEAGWKVVISPVSLIVLPHHVHHNCLESRIVKICTRFDDPILQFICYQTFRR